MQFLKNWKANIGDVNISWRLKISMRVKDKFEKIVKSPICHLRVGESFKNQLRRSFFAISISQNF